MFLNNKKEKGKKKKKRKIFKMKDGRKKMRFCLAIAPPIKAARGFGSGGCILVRGRSLAYSHNRRKSQSPGRAINLRP